MLMIVHGRPEQLNRTLHSLYAVRGFSKDRLFVSQDGHDPNVSALIRQEGLKLAVHDDNLPEYFDDMQKWQIAAARIALHYKWSLERAFSAFDAEAPGFIILEDDLLFSPDFLDYFHSVAPLLEDDRSLWLASAWNDNGFEHLVHDTKALHRTTFMPGLGWLMPRRVWEEELVHRWSGDIEHQLTSNKPFQLNWDHWLRDEERHHGREVVYPQVPRVFHNGTQGTFMNEELHQRYFASIATNWNNSISWGRPSRKNGLVADVDVARAKTKSYEKRVRKMIKRAYAPKNVQDLRRVLDEQSVQEVVIWAFPWAKPTQDDDIERVWNGETFEDADKHMKDGFEPFATFFGLWDERKRGEHNGMHEFWWGQTHVFLVDVKTSKYGDLKQRATVFDAEAILNEVAPDRRIGSLQ